MRLTLRFKGGAGSGNFNHSGRPGEIGGSSTSSSQSNFHENWITRPSNITDLQKTLQSTARLDNVRRHAQGLKPIDDNSPRVPGFLHNGELVFSKRPGAHRDAKPIDKGVRWEDEQTRFGLTFNKDYTQVTMVEIVQEALGVELDDRAFSRKTEKLLDSILRKVNKFGVPSGTHVRIHTSKLDENYNTVILDTTL